MTDDVNTERERLPFEIGEGMFMPFMLANNYGLRVILWTSLSLCLLIVTCGLLIWPLMEPLSEVLTLWNDDITGEQVLKDNLLAVSLFAGLLLVYAFVYLLILCSGEAAIYENYFHGLERSRFPLNFGMNMWRVLGAKIVYFLVAVTLVFILLFPVTWLSERYELSDGIGALYILLLIVFMVWVSIRLTPMAAISVRDKKLKFRQAFIESKGRVWWVLLTLILIWIGNSIIENIITYGFFAAFLMNGALSEQLSTMEDISTLNEGVEVLKSLLSPEFIMWGVFMVAIMIVLATIVHFLYISSPAHVAKLYRNEQAIAENWKE